MLSYYWEIRPFGSEVTMDAYNFFLIYKLYNCERKAFTSVKANFSDFTAYLYHCHWRNNEKLSNTPRNVEVLIHFLSKDPSTKRCR